MGRALIACIAAASVVSACAPEPLATDPIARGRQVYHQMNCGSCHEPNLLGQRIGPPLDHIGSVAATRRPGSSAEAYLRMSITDPGAYVVPGYTDSMPRGLDRSLSPEDLDALIAYLASLR